MSGRTFPSKIHIAKGVTIGPYSIIGRPYRPVEGRELPAKFDTSVGPNTYVGAHVCVGRGTRIVGDAILEDFARTEQDVYLGRRVHLLYQAQIFNDARIERDSHISRLHARPESRCQPPT